MGRTGRIGRDHLLGGAGGCHTVPSSMRLALPNQRPLNAQGWAVIQLDLWPGRSSGPMASPTAPQWRVCAGPPSC
ncbi:hypothetical protein ACFFX0_21445 [Citricoccus parietis]|uniref:Helicase C-terminal domain-containing protein n=1 Tax=Citricoccus parietis TaxID=592307 RepID=A0ABV5G3X5_9MICC